MIRPEAAPETTPESSPMAKATGMDMPASTISLTVTTPDRATTEPTDRSMPPIKMHSMIPTARLAFVVICRMTFIIFLEVRKCSDQMLNMVKKRRKAASIPMLVLK